MTFLPAGVRQLQVASISECFEIGDFMSSTAPSSHLAPDARRSATMWVVNSDDEVRQLVESALRQYGQYLMMRLIFTEDLGTSVTSAPPQVVLINLTGPAQSSLALLTKTRQRWPDAKVIFLSPLDDIHLWAETIRMGAYDFLPKPIDPDQLKWVLIGAFPTVQLSDSKALAASAGEQT